MILDKSESEVLPADYGLSTAIRTDDKFRMDLEKKRIQALYRLSLCLVSKSLQVRDSESSAGAAALNIFHMSPLWHISASATMRLSLAGRMLPQDFIQPPFAEILLTGQYARETPISGCSVSNGDRY